MVSEYKKLCSPSTKGSECLPTGANIICVSVHTWLAFEPVPVTKEKNFMYKTRPSILREKPGPQPSTEERMT
jgi:hypothetical protein